MAVGLSLTKAHEYLTDLTTTHPYMKLHIGDPGSAGTSAPAGETDRTLVVWGAPAGGIVSNSASIQWAGVSTTEDYTHYSLWSASTAGTFGHSGLVTANPVTAGDTLTFAVGAFDIASTVAT